MRERLNISPGTPLISSQMGEVQGGTPTWAASQLMDSGRPPPVIWRRAVLSQGHVPQAAAAVPQFIRDMQVALGTAPNVNTSQMTTIPGDVQMGAPSQMFMAQGSVVSMRVSSEFEHSRFRELGRQLAIAPRARKNRPTLVLQAWVPPEVLLRMMSLQDELREAQVNLAVRNGIASAKQQVAERSLELVNQRMQLLEQEKDEWKRRVGQMQPEPLETQRYEAAFAPRAAGQPARDEGVPSPDLGEVQVKDELDEKDAAPVPATWMHCLLFVTLRKGVSCIR